MDCEKCKLNNNCKKPYESEVEYQYMYLGRTYTKDEWLSEGVCNYYEKTLEKFDKRLHL